MEVLYSSLESIDSITIKRITQSYPTGGLLKETQEIITPYVSIHYILPSYKSKLQFEWIFNAL